MAFIVDHVMTFIVDNAAAFSDLFGLLASVFLFIPLIGLSRAARQFREIGELVNREGFSPEDVRKLQKQIKDVQFGDGRIPWLWLAGISFALAFLMFVIAWN